ncbi:MAG TPA: hypothetical protein VKS80_12705 [Trinickia sp.]|nr:hypothetical protein [Trinickia sp.]
MSEPLTGISVKDAFVGGVRAPELRHATTQYHAMAEGVVRLAGFGGQRQLPEAWREPTLDVNGAHREFRAKAG